MRREREREKTTNRVERRQQPNDVRRVYLFPKASGLCFVPECGRKLGRRKKKKGRRRTCTHTTNLIFKVAS